MNKIKKYRSSLVRIISFITPLVYAPLVRAQENGPVERVVDETTNVQATNRYTAIMIGVVLLAGAAFSLWYGLKRVNQTTKKSRRKKTRFVPVERFHKGQFILFTVLLAAVGVGSIISTLAAPPALNKASWAGKVPLRVYDQGTRVNVAAIIAPWNQASGRTILQPTNTPANAHIVFTRPADGRTTWVYRNDTVCYIYVGSDYGPDTQTMQHELGHCLGFRDHVQASALAGRNSSASPVCDTPGHPQYLPYRGIMSYCDWSNRSTWFGADDKSGLTSAGYRKNTVTTTSTTPKLLCKQRTLSINTKGEATCIRYLENALNAHGYPPGAIDGKFDQATRQALLNFQRSPDRCGNGCLKPYASGTADAITASHICWNGVSGPYKVNISYSEYCTKRP